jgi:uncharacterized protein YkwD
MILQTGSPRSVKHSTWQPPLKTIPEDESCGEWSFARVEKGRLVENDPVSLVNRERLQRNLIPFGRSDDLDYLARVHAMRMAAAKTVFHSVASIDELKMKMRSDKVGENIQRGDSVSSMHQETMASASVNRSNLLSMQFDEFGVATAIGGDGKIYSCQFFRKRGSKY